METKVTVKTREGTILDLPEIIKSVSKFIRETVEDSVLDEEIHCDVSEAAFKLIMEFFEHHGKEVKSIKKPVKISNYTTLTSEWDTNFFKKLDDEQLSELLFSSSYLQIDSLYDYCCAFIACQFKDMTDDDVRKKYNITDELTPEVEDHLRKEFSNILNSNSDH